MAWATPFYTAPLHPAFTHFFQQLVTIDSLADCFVAGLVGKTQSDRGFGTLRLRGQQFVRLIMVRE